MLLDACLGFFMRFVLCLLPLLALAKPITAENFSLPLYENHFIEDFAQDSAMLNHSENNVHQHYAIAGQSKYDPHNMHIALGPDFGMVMRLNIIDTKFDGSGGATYKMPGFDWNTKFDEASYDFKAHDANLRLHARNYYTYHNVQFIPYSGLDYLALTEKQADLNRNTTLFYLPVGVAIMPRQDLVVQFAVSGMVWGDVQVDNAEPEVDKGFGLLMGLLWHKSKNSNCFLDLSLRKYGVKGDSFALKSAEHTNTNSLSAWNLKCDVSL